MVAKDHGSSITYRVNKDGTGTWTVNFRIDGKSRKESFGGRNGKPSTVNEQAAKDFQKQIAMHGGGPARKKLLAEATRTGPAITFAEWATKYLDPTSGLLTGIEPGTRAEYQRILTQALNPILGDIPVDEIDKTTIGKWVTWQEQQESKRRNGTDGNPQLVSAKTVKNRHGLLSNILKAATDNGLIPNNPAYRTRLSAGLAEEAVFLSVADYNALYNAIADRWKPLVAFLVGSQCRLSEALALTWADLNRDTDPPTVRVMKAWKRNPDGPAVIGTTKSRKGRRTVALWPALVKELGKPGRAKDLVFCNEDGSRISRSTFRNAWERAIKTSGIGVHPRIHDLRHTGASWLIADGVPLPFIQQRLGHANIQTTVGVYGHLLPDAHTRMADSLSHTLSRAVTEHKQIEEAR